MHDSPTIVRAPGWAGRRIRRACCARKELGAGFGKPPALTRWRVCAISGHRLTIKGSGLSGDKSGSSQVFIGPHPCNVLDQLSDENQVGRAQHSAGMSERDDACSSTALQLRCCWSVRCRWSHAEMLAAPHPEQQLTAGAAMLQIVCETSPASSTGSHPVTVVVDGEPDSFCCFTYSQQATPSECNQELQLGLPSYSSQLDQHCVSRQPDAVAHHTPCRSCTVRSPDIGTALTCDPCSNRARAACRRAAW